MNSLTVKLFLALFCLTLFILLLLTLFFWAGVFSDLDKKSVWIFLKTWKYPNWSKTGKKRMVLMKENFDSYDLGGEVQVLNLNDKERKENTWIPLGYYPLEAGTIVGGFIRTKRTVKKEIVRIDEEGVAYYL